MAAHHPAAVAPRAVVSISAGPHHVLDGTFHGLGLGQLDEVRVVEDVVASGDGDYWELSTQLVSGGDDEPPLPYGIAALMPMVAAAPANLQTREVVFEIPKK